MKNKLIVVLGMHRSGTSVITRGLQVMGVELGDRMMLPVEGNNPKGFWEDIDINKLNIDSLDAIGSDWNHLAPIEPDNVEVLRKKGYFLQAVELLRKKTGNSPAFGFKDPRVAKLLPFWKEVFGYCHFDVKYVLTIRHPLSVVKSLAKRDRMEAEQGYLLWLCHVITSLTGSDGEDRVIVDYDRFMQSPDSELIRIAQCVDLEIDNADLETFKSGFMDQGLRHTLYDQNELSLDDSCPDVVRDAYTKLFKVASDNIDFSSAELNNKIARWVVEYERIKPALKLVDKLLIKNADVDQLLDKRNMEVEKQEAIINHFRQELNDKDKLLHQRNLEVLEKDKLLHQRNLNVLEKDELLHQRNLEVLEKDKLLNQRNLEVLEKDKLLNQRNLEVLEKDALLHKRNLELMNKDELLDQRNQEINNRDTLLQQYNLAMREKDVLIDQRNQDLEERDTRIATLESEINAKNTVLMNLVEEKSILE